MIRNVAKFQFWASVCFVVIGVAGIGGFWGPLCESTSWAAPKDELEEKAKSGSGALTLLNLPENMMGHISSFLDQGTILTKFKPSCKGIDRTLTKPGVRNAALPKDVLSGLLVRWSKLKNYTALKTDADAKQQRKPKGIMEVAIKRQFGLQFEYPEEFIAFLNDPIAQEWVTGLSFEFKFL